MTNSINIWLDHLRVLCPPAGVLLVGAGAGTSNWVQRLAQWETPNVTLIEADEAQFQHLQRTAPTRADWHLHKQVISGNAESLTFHQASNSAESGLVEPEALQSLWPNIKTRNRQTRQAITLADLQQDAETPANWLMVDCLPALAIIRGGADQLSAFDLIAVRVLLDDGTLPHGMASQGEVRPFLEALGFRCLASEAGRHPAFGHALFLRDSQAAARQLHQKLGQHAEVHLAQAQKLTEAQAANLALTTQIQQLKDALEQTKIETAATALNLAEERSVLAQKLSQAEAVSEKLTKELQLQIEQLNRTHDQTVQLLIAETEQLKTGVQTEGAAWAQAKAELTQTRDNASKLAAERQQQLEELKRTQTQSVQALQSQLEQMAATTQSHSAAWASEKLELSQALEQADKLTKESQLQIEQHKQAAEQAKVKLNATETSAAATAKLVEERTAQVQQLSQARAAADKLAADRQQQLEQLQQAQSQSDKTLKAEIERIQTSLQTEKGDWAKERANLSQARTTAENLTAERQAQIQALEQRLQHLQANSAEAEARHRNAQTISAEAEKRYSMMQNELIKAEAQMSLIKDLLLREQPR